VNDDKKRTNVQERAHIKQDDGHLHMTTPSPSRSSIFSVSTATYHYRSFFLYVIIFKIIIHLGPSSGPTGRPSLSSVRKSGLLTGN
jgi:hypothetical protein